MKPIVSHSQVVEITGNDMGNFSIANSESGKEKAFQILCDNLYSNKIMAVVRETICNALDAHKMANVTRHVTVSVPTTKKCSFVVRDYGHGLSEHEMVNLYCTLFASSKENRNDATGYLGLGSKSPFAYTNSFTVTSHHNGIKTIYSVNRINNKIPTLTKMGEYPTDETGVEVVIPVMSHNVDEFKSCIGEFVKWCEDKVDSGMFFNNVGLLIKHSYAHNFKSTEEFGWIVSSTGTSKVIMGNVEYPLVKHAQLPKLPDYSLCLFMPIGQLNVSPSRETLSYDEMTIASLSAAISKVKAQLLKKTQEKIDSLTLLEAIRHMNNLPSELVTNIYHGKSIDIVDDGRIIVPHICVNITYSKCYQDKVGPNEALRGSRVTYDTVLINRDAPKRTISNRLGHSKYRKCLVFESNEVETLISAGILHSEIVDLSSLPYFKKSCTTKKAKERYYSICNTYYSPVDADKEDITEDSLVLMYKNKKFSCDPLKDIYKPNVHKLAYYYKVYATNDNSYPLNFYDILKEKLNERMFRFEYFGYFGRIRRPEEVLSFLSKINLPETNQIVKFMQSQCFKQQELYSIIENVGITQETQPEQIDLIAMFNSLSKYPVLYSALYCGYPTEMENKIIVSINKLYTGEKE